MYGFVVRLELDRSGKNAVVMKAKHTYSPFTYKCHKSNIKNLLMKSSDIVFIFLLAFYLVIWLMKSPKNFEKMSILKI